VLRVHFRATRSHPGTPHGQIILWSGTNVRSRSMGVLVAVPAHEPGETQQAKQADPAIVPLFIMMPRGFHLRAAGRGGRRCIARRLRRGRYRGDHEGNARRNNGKVSVDVHVIRIRTGRGELGVRVYSDDVLRDAAWSRS
jgi:hypothetical protein